MQALARSYGAMMQYVVAALSKFDPVPPGHVLMKGAEERPEIIPGKVSESIGAGDSFGIRQKVYGV